MAPRKKTRKRSSTPRKRATHRKASRSEKEPNYMVQISEPKMVRKDILESLREVIIFMQGYEQFNRIQDDKIMNFQSLREQIKEIDLLINTKLRKYLPKGKLTPVSYEEEAKQRAKEEKEEHGFDVMEEAHEEARKPTVTRSTTTVSALNEAPEAGDLDRLESQLKDIEDQLRGIH